MEVTAELARFQAFKDPVSGSLVMQAYWQDVVTFNDDTPPIIGNQLHEYVNRSYSDLAAADAAGLGFPGFAELAAQFAQAPFTAFCALLEALREVQEAERAAQAEQAGLGIPGPQPAGLGIPGPLPAPEEEPS